MMPVGLDSSVVLRLITGEPEVESQAARVWLTEWLRSGGSAKVSDLVVAEAYHALQYHYGMSKKDALGGTLPHIPFPHRIACRTSG